MERTESMASQTVVRRGFRVTGKVQGVWFRESARQESERIGALSGWIRNETDGSVRGEVQGPQENVGSFLAWCRTGPPRSQVDSVRIEELPLAANEHRFEVQR